VNRFRERLAKLKRDRDLDNASAAHWNRLHPNEEPLPESDPAVDAAIEAAEAAINTEGKPA